MEESWKWVCHIKIAEWLISGKLLCMKTRLLNWPHGRYSEWQKDNVDCIVKHCPLIAGNYNSYSADMTLDQRCCAVLSQHKVGTDTQAIHPSWLVLYIYTFVLIPHKWYSRVYIQIQTRTWCTSKLCRADSSSSQSLLYTRIWLIY